MSDLSNRLPPQNQDAERSLLGAVMSDEGALLSVIDIVSPEDFYVNAHKIIFETIKNLFSEGTRGLIDTVLVADRLRSNNKLDEVGGEAYLVSLVSDMFIAANAPQYAQIVAEKALLRDLLGASRDIASGIYDVKDGSAKLALEEAEKRILGVSDRRANRGFVKVGECVVPVFEQIQEIASTKQLKGIRTGFAALDNVFYGIKEGNLVIIAGRPGAGKTAMMLNIAENIAIKQNIPVAFFNLEMSKEELTMRILSQVGNIDNSKFRNGDMNQDDWDKLVNATEKVVEAPLYIDDSMDNTITSVRSSCRKIKARHDVKIVFIDYLQLMISDSKNENRATEVAEMSRSLKMLARELGVPIVVGAQLNRESDKEKRKPQVSDLRESGSIEQDADIVMLLHRESIKNPTPENEHEAEVIIGKNRNGRLANLDFYYDGDTMNFKSIAKNLPEAPK